MPYRILFMNASLKSNAVACIAAMFAASAVTANVLIDGGFETNPLSTLPTVIANFNAQQGI